MIKLFQEISDEFFGKSYQKIMKDLEFQKYEDLKYMDTGKQIFFQSYI